ncbi:MAG: hypothetical protein JXK07_07125 [Spirochaetes bacterium]|nr:hypothetical protein [Spirochaetota bacterium]MBN2769627.1 hypothetical protein [Spirochaetota bacterium]
MSGSVFLTNCINLFIIGFILETALSAVFSITAVRMVDDKLVVKTTKEAVTYITAFLVLYFMSTFRIFSGTGVKIPIIADYIISSLITVKFALLIRDLFAKAGNTYR